MSKMPYGWGKVPFDFESRRKWADIPFSVEEYEGRIAGVRETMRERGFDALIVYGTRGDRGAIRYLTNFEDYYKGDNLCVIPAEGEPAFTTNSVFHGEPMHSGIQHVWMRDVRCAAHPRTASDAVSVFDHLGDILSEQGVSDGTIALSGESAAAIEGTSPRNPPQSRAHGRGQTDGRGHDHQKSCRDRSPQGERPDPR